MKIKILKNYKYNLFKLNLIKAKFKKNEPIDSLVVSLGQMELHFKKVLKIIYEYHINNKKILFVGLFNKPLQTKFKKILKKTNHSTIPNSIWVNGLLSNKSAIYRNLKLKRLKNIKKQRYNINSINSLLSITKKPDLIVIFKRSLDSNVITEISKLQIPSISLNNTIPFDSKATYEVPEDFLKMNQQLLNLFFTLLFSLINKDLNKIYGVCNKP